MFCFSQTPRARLIDRRDFFSFLFLKLSDDTRTHTPTYTPTPNPVTSPQNHPKTKHFSALNTACPTSTPACARSSSTPGPAPKTPSATPPARLLPPPPSPPPPPPRRPPLCVAGCHHVIRHELSTRTNQIPNHKSHPTNNPPTLCCCRLCLVLLLLPLLPLVGPRQNLRLAQLPPLCGHSDVDFGQSHIYMMVHALVLFKACHVHINIWSMP